MCCKWILWKYLSILEKFLEEVLENISQRVLEKYCFWMCSRNSDLLSSRKNLVLEKNRFSKKKSSFRKNIRCSKIPLYREFSYENFEMSWFAKVTSSSISKLSDLEKITIFSKKWVFEKMCYVLDNVSFRKTKIKIIEIVQDR